MRCLAASILVVAIPACGDDAAPAPGRGLDRPTGELIGVEPVTDDPMRRNDGVEPPRREDEPTTYEVQEQVRLENGVPVTEPPPRDYGTELRTIAGDPMSCVPVDAIPPATQEIEIDVEATVTELGMVTRAYVRSPGLPADAVDCLVARVERGRFRAPVEAAPRTVRTTLELRRRRLVPAPVSP